MTSIATTQLAVEEEIDFATIWGRLIDHKWLIIIITTTFLMMSLGYAFLSAPIYEADSLVQVEQKIPDLPGLSDLTETLGASNSEASTEIAIITSRTILGGAAARLNMFIQVAPHQFPLFGHFVSWMYTPATPNQVATPWFGLSRYGWGGDKLDIFQLKVPDTLLNTTMTLIVGQNGEYTLWHSSWVPFWPWKKLLDGKVGEVSSGSGVTIAVKTLNANPGMRFDVYRPSDLAEIGALQLNLQANETVTDSGVIALTFDDANPQQAEDYLNLVDSIYVKQNVDYNSAQAAQSLLFVRQQLPGIRKTLDDATARLNAYQNKAKSVDITMQTKGLLDQEVGVETSIYQLKEQMVDTERRYTSNHPAYKSLQQQIGLFQSQKDAIDKQVSLLPDSQQELLKLTRDVTVSDTTYTSLLAQAQQLDIARAGTVGNVRVVDPATVDTTQPVKPKKALVIAGGTMLGFLLSVGFVFLRQMLRRGVEDPADFEKAGIAVYASIPASAQQAIIAPGGRGMHSDGNQHLLVLSAPDDKATEALRSLRTSLHFARLEAKNNILMISGPSPNAGKTFISGNLAAAVAQTGQRVLIVDGDLRLGSLHKVIGGKPEQGLSELISGQIDLAQATRAVPNVDTLFFISRGKAPPNPSELLMTERFTALLERLKPLYDLIIIDTPPILAVTDAAVIGNHAGTSLLVVRFGLNQVREIVLAKQRFEQNGVEIKGAIFNAVEKRHAGYSSYGYYEYSKA
jgi:tyrosine-protein kinase Etk/Wzc